MDIVAFVIFFVVYIFGGLFVLFSIGIVAMLCLWVYSLVKYLYKSRFDEKKNRLYKRFFFSIPILAFTS